MDENLTEGGPGSCKRSCIRRRDLDESQVLVVELWEDLHGPKRLEVCGWTRFRGSLRCKPNTKGVSIASLGFGEIDRSEKSINRRKISMSSAKRQTGDTARRQLHEIEA